MFRYFGYGSNMNTLSLRAKGVQARASDPALLRGWRLRFNVKHFFRHEGGVGNIEHTGDPADAVHGVLHECDDEHLALLDAAEAFGHGYDRVEVLVRSGGREQRAIAYVGIEAFLDDACRPTRRYMNILLQGAAAAGLAPEYIDALGRQPLHERVAVLRFVAPPGDYPAYTAQSLARHPLLTALAGAVFDMTHARWQHEFLKGLFGGKDMTLFHLQRLDHSDGRETLDDLRLDRLSPAQRMCLDEYLYEYSHEYVYAGRYLYAPP